MESQITPDGRYYSVYQYLRVGSKQYAVLVAEQAAQRAASYFDDALKLLEGPQTPETQLEVNKELVLATDFGSKDAPFLLAQRFLDAKAQVAFPAEEIVVFLKIAAERGHDEAAFQMGCSYAAMGTFLAIEQIAAGYFSSFSAEERGQLAEYYFIKAIELGHPQAIQELIISYGYGRGYIGKSAEKFISLCEQQTKAKNQSVALGYGAWLMGMTVEGKPSLAEAVQIPLASWRALDCLLLASRGKHLALAQHALRLICVGIAKGVWEHKTLGRQRLGKCLVKDATDGNSLLALYLAWYSIPKDFRTNMPTVLRDCELVELADIVKPDEELAIAYLDSAFFGSDEDISTVAQELLSHVFGQCFMNDDGMLVWQ